MTLITPAAHKFNLTFVPEQSLLWDPLHQSIIAPGDKSSWITVLVFIVIRSEPKKSMLKSDLCICNTVVPLGWEVCSMKEKRIDAWACKINTRQTYVDMLLKWFDCLHTEKHHYYKIIEVFEMIWLSPHQRTSWLQDHLIKRTLKIQKHLSFKDSLTSKGNT
jgi:hypothetical protein